MSLFGRKLEYKDGQKDCVAASDQWNKNPFWLTVSYLKNEWFCHYFWEIYYLFIIRDSFFAFCIILCFMQVGYIHDPTGS